MNFSLFHAGRPGTLVYFWAYLVVGLIILAVLLYERGRSEALVPR